MWAYIEFYHVYMTNSNIHLYICKWYSMLKMEIVVVNKLLILNEFDMVLFIWYHPSSNTYWARQVSVSSEIAYDPQPRIL